MLYDEVTYWSKYRDNPNAENANREKSILYVQDNLIGCQNILDFGPGVGQIFPAFMGMRKVTGFDITDKWEAELRQKAEEIGFEFYFVSSSKIGALPFKDNQFDAAVAMSVFLHQQPKHIVGVMTELARVACKVIVSTWREPSKHYDTETKQNHCYNYNYPKICDDNGLKYDIIEGSRQTGKIYFVYWVNT